MLDQEFNSVNPNASVWPHALRNGLIWALIAIVMQLTMYYTGSLEETLSGTYSTVTVFSSIVSFLVAIWFIRSAIVAYREDLGALTFGNAVKAGAATGVIYGLILGIWSFVFYTFMFPDFQEFMQEMMYAQYEEAGMDEDAIETAMGFASMFTSPGYLAIMSVISGAITATIVSLIAGIFLKTE